MPRFNGVAVEEEKKPRFGGVPIESQGSDPRIQEQSLESPAQQTKRFTDYLFPELATLEKMEAKSGINPRDDHSLNPFKIAGGMAETLMQMGSGFFGAIPGVASGTYEAIKEGDADAYAPAFKETQEAFTYEPRTSKGKKYSGVMGEIFALPDEPTEKYLVEPNLEQGNPEAALAGKVGVEALKMLAPIRIAKGRGGIAKPELKNIEMIEAPKVETPPKPPAEEGFSFRKLMTEEPQPRFKGTPIETKPFVKPVESRSFPKGNRFEGEPIEPSIPPEWGAKPIETFESMVRPEAPAQPKGLNLKIDPQKDSLFQAIGKLGGLNKEDAIRNLGVDPRENIQSGAFGAPVLRGKGQGKPVDVMAEALAEEGYLQRDPVTGKWDMRDFENMFFEEYAGRKQHHPSRMIPDENINAEYEQYLKDQADTSTFRTGLPINEVGKLVKTAERNLKDVVAIPEEGVEILKPEIASQPGLLNPFKSPRKVAEKFPELKPFKELADEAVRTQDKYRNIFSKRLGAVDRVLGGGLKKVKDFGKNYRANKTTLNDLLLEGDMIGKRFSTKELQERGISPSVISGYKLIRSAYDHALTEVNKSRGLREKSPVSKREGYIPHFFHSWMIRVNGRLITSARTLREAVSLGNKAARMGGDVKIMPKQFEFPGERQQAVTMGDWDYFKMQKNLQDTFSMTPEEATSLMNTVANRRGRSRFVGNFMERKGTPGWEQNLDYAHRHYFNMIGRYTALDKFKSKAISKFESRFGPLDKEHRGTARYIKNYINDINGVPTHVENLINSSLANTPALSKFLGKYFGDRPALQLASMTNKGVAIAKLGIYNMSAALVNGSQLMMANALLGPKWTAKGLLRAGKINLKQMGLKKAPNPDIGILKKIGIDVQQGLESGAGYSKFNQVGKIFESTLAPFMAAEFELRATAGLGAYYKGLSEGMTKPEAIQYAKQVNTRANFDYSIADAPSFIRQSGPVGQVLFQFKKFPVKAMEFMSELKGAEHARFWIPFVTIAGLYGFPGMEAMKNAVKSMFDIDLELESKDYFIRWAGDDPEKKAIAKTIMYGAFANDELGGIDLSRRIGGGDFIPSRGSDLLGPFFSSGIRAMQMASEEEWADMVRQITTTPGNIAIALKNDGEIFSPWERDRMVVKLNPREQVLKGLGFTSTRERIERDVPRIMRYNERKQRDAEQDAIDAFIKVYEEGDEVAIDEAIKELAELGVTSRRIKEEMAKKKMTRTERAFDNLSRRGKYRNLDLFDFGRSVKPGAN